tara:strand:- start:625 stop:759 length:135 start_codon:yes stop_codon:yes gene_type:complete
LDDQKIAPISFQLFHFLILKKRINPIKANGEIKKYKNDFSSIIF